MSEIESINERNRDLFSPEEVDRFSDPKEARKKAMDYLARREYGQRELEQKLIAAGFESVTVAATVDKLTGEGLQDDRRFIENFVHSRINQGKGPIRVRQELGERGLNTGLARLVRDKKFGPGLPRDFKEKARQMRFLQYRGFDSDHLSINEIHDQQ